MSKLRRYKLKGYVYFITCVTHERRSILLDNSELFDAAFASTRRRSLFETTALVLLPDHFHAIIDPNEADISSLLQRIKMSFGALLRKRLGVQSGRVWQHRFWDHVIRDQDDWNRHVDYIHYNPVKHGFVKAPADWQYSTFAEYRKKGFYSDDWGVKETIEFDGEFGE